MSYIHAKRFQRSVKTTTLMVRHLNTACLSTPPRHARTLFLLNLNLPRMDGREVLALIKADDSLKSIPTVILTTSEAEADIVKSYHLQANCYLSKPVELEAFENLVKSINDFWLTRAKLPREQEFT